MKCCDSAIGAPCGHRTIVASGQRVWWLDAECIAHVGTVVEQLPEHAGGLVHVVRIASSRGQYVIDQRTTDLHVITRYGA